MPIRQMILVGLAVHVRNDATKLIGFDLCGIIHSRVHEQRENCSSSCLNQV
jgi:hypothetical protein